MILVNGREENVETPITVAEFLEQKRYRIDRIAVEKNGDIVPKRMYTETKLESGDRLEVVSFVGGG